jgi:hypothetical protein
LLACTSLVTALALLAPAPRCQSNAVAGLDVALQLEGFSYRGHLGTYPNGRAGFTQATTACNPGRVPVNWFGAMNADHPVICFMILREAGGRLEQISERCYGKHGFSSSNGTACGTPCTPPPLGTTQLGVGCSDTYGTTTNAGVTSLAPLGEIDPWLGGWTAVGSYFDRGEPDVGFPANVDGVRSPITIADPVTHRNVVPDARLADPTATYYYAAYYMVAREAEAVRDNNLGSRRFVPTWSGSAWSVSVPSSGNAMVAGTPLLRWAGATVRSAANTDAGGVARDGRFYVAVRVTPVGVRWWRYEYAVHNRDNHGGAAQLRVPMCAGARWRAAGFKDVDLDATNQWTVQRTATELVFDAPAGHPQSWNTVYNFWFESDATPQSAPVELVQAVVNPGASTSVSVASQAPVRLANVHLAPGCGTPELSANSSAVIPNPGFALVVEQLAPGASVAFLQGLAGASLPLFGCVLHVDPAASWASATAVADGTGRLARLLPVPVAPALEGVDVWFQAVELRAGGTLLGVAELSNGLRVRIGSMIAGCP